MPKNTNEIYQEVTDTIVSALREGIVPWNRNFTVEGGLHRSFSTHKAYRGGNQFYLDLIALSKGYKSPFWITMNQIKKNGGTLKKINKPEEKGTGQKSSIVFFFKMIPSKELDKDGKPESYWPILKSFNVFNLDQVEGIEAPVLDASEYSPEERAESIIMNMPNLPSRNLDSREPVGYDAALDLINQHATESFASGGKSAPIRETFYYLVASTAHSSRLSRKPDYGQDPTYNKETLIREMGAAMLSGLCELPLPDYKPSESYLNGWIEVLEENPKLAVQAASKAQGAADYILGPDEEEEDE